MDDFLDLLSEGMDPERLSQFRLPEATQQQLDLLLEKNRAGTLTARENAELESFEKLEHLVRLLKARLLQKKAS
jgi:ubiquinone biosynthesis protein COQ9